MNLKSLALNALLTLALGTSCGITCAFGGFSQSDDNKTPELYSTKNDSDFLHSDQAVNNTPTQKNRLHHQDFPYNSYTPAPSMSESEAIMAFYLCVGIAFSGYHLFNPSATSLTNTIFWDASLLLAAYPLYWAFTHLMPNLLCLINPAWKSSSNSTPEKN